MKFNPKPIFINLVLIFVLIGGAVNWAKCQDKSEGTSAFAIRLDSDSDEYSGLIEYVDSLLHIHYPFVATEYQENDTTQISKIFDVSFLSDSLSESFSKYYEFRAKRLSRDWGLRLSGYYNYNIRPGIDDDEDNYYHQRAYLGLDWNILSSGLVENQHRAQSMRYELELNRLDEEREQIRENYIYRYNYIMYVFNHEKMRIISDRLNLLKGQESLYMQLFYKRNIDWETVLKLKGRINELESKYRSFYDYNWLKKTSLPVYGSLQERIDGLPFLDVDPGKLMTLYETNSADSVRNELMVEKFRNKYRFLDDVTLRPFFRYNILETANRNVIDYPSVGVSAGVPLRFGPSGRKVAEAELEHYTAENNKEVSQRKLDLLNLYYEHQYKKYQLIGFYFKKAEIKERIRGEESRMTLKSKTFSPLHLLALLEERLAVESELVDLKKELYLNVLKMQAMVFGADVAMFTLPMELEALTKRYRGIRSVYIWSELFRETETAALITDLNFNEFKQVMLSPGGDFPKGKLTDFLEKCKLKGIECTNLIGNNQMIFYSDEEISERLNKSHVQGFSGIHLDIEPHTFDDWKEREEEYLTKLVDVFVRVRAWTNEKGMTLSVSIPAFYPEKYLRLIYDNVDNAFIMVYETNKPETIIRRSSEELSLNPQKTVVAIRPKDFTSRMEMESAIEKVMQKTAVRQFAFHDLKGIHNMDMLKSKPAKGLSDDKPSGERTVVPAKAGDAEPQESQEAVRKVEALDEAQNIENYVFRIQVSASTFWIEPEEIRKRLKLEEEIKVFFRKGLYKYTIKEFSTLQEGLEELKEVRKRENLEGAFVLKTGVSEESEKK